MNYRIDTPTEVYHLPFPTDDAAHEWMWNALGVRLEHGGVNLTLLDDPSTAGIEVAS